MDKKLSYGQTPKGCTWGDESNTIPVISGVPQGSVLGLLFFLVYIDEVIRVPLSVGSKLVLYADDMLLYRKIA